MAKGNFDKAHARIRVYEGGNVDDPKDPGGRTSRGVTKAVYDAWCRRNNIAVGDVWKAPDSHIARIYKELYWDRCACDQLPAGIDFVVFDSAVNSGVAQAAKWAQRAIGFNPQGRSGGFGYLTVQALNEQADNDAVVADMMARRLATLKGLKTWSRFGKGWGARIANATKIGQAWATGSVGPNPVNVAVVGLLGNTKAMVEDNVSKPTLTTGQVNATTVVTTSASAVSEVTGAMEGFRGVFEWAPYVLVTLAVLSAVLGLVIRYLHAKAEKIEKGEAETEIDYDADFEAVPVPINDNYQEPMLPVDQLPGALGQTA